jgi:hypothetical protein
VRGVFPKPAPEIVFAVAGSTERLSGGDSERCRHSKTRELAIPCLAHRHCATHELRRVRVVLITSRVGDKRRPALYAAEAISSRFPQV